MYPGYGLRAYSINNKGRVTGFSLDYFLLTDDQTALLTQLKELQFISLQCCFYEDYKFLNKFKKLSSLNISDNSITDAQFIARRSRNQSQNASLVKWLRSQEASLSGKMVSKNVRYNNQH